MQLSYELSRGRRIFAERLPHLAVRYGRRTTRLDEIVRLFGHSAGGRSSEQLISRLGMSVSDTTILRSIKEAARPKAGHVPVRVVGIDEWAWRKGLNYGTIIVDLEQRQVVGLLGDRSSSTSAAWFREHPELEIINPRRASRVIPARRIMAISQNDGQRAITCLCYTGRTQLMRPLNNGSCCGRSVHPPRAMISASPVGR